MTDESSGAPTGRSSDDEVRFELGSDLQAPRRARAAVRHALDHWQLTRLVEPISLAVSELVTNAVVHGGPPVDLTVRRRVADVRIDVHDNDPQPPPWATSSANVSGGTSGRGLGIVVALADDVGCDQVLNDGKVVYASFRTMPR